MSIVRSANPGRWARADAGGGLIFDVERVSPSSIDLLLGRESARVQEEFAEAMMRALADVLGYEIGARHEV